MKGVEVNVSGTSRYIPHSSIPEDCKDPMSSGFDENTILNTTLKKSLWLQNIAYDSVTPFVIFSIAGCHCVSVPFVNLKLAAVLLLPVYAYECKGWVMHNI